MGRMLYGPSDRLSPKHCSTPVGGEQRPRGPGRILTPLRRITVRRLTAFQGVEDNLAALRILEQEAQQQHEATASAEDWLQVSMNRYTGGVDNYLQVTIAQTSALSNERNEADILRRRMDASVLLIKAVGGGLEPIRASEGGEFALTTA